MSLDQFLQVAAIVVPIVSAVVADGIRTRTRLAVVEAVTRDQGTDLAELTRRQARHERDPVHARMSGPQSWSGGWVT